MVKRISPLSPAQAVLRENDVITHINHAPIADDCTLTLRHDERISMMHAIRRAHIGDEVILDILRGGTPSRVAYHLGHCLYKLPGLHGMDCWPSFYIYGPPPPSMHALHACTSYARVPGLIHHTAASGGRE